jgi:uncharacterized protein
MAIFSARGLVRWFKTEAARVTVPPIAVVFPVALGLLSCGGAQGFGNSPFAEWMGANKLRPYVVDWKADERVRLETRMRQGGVVLGVTEAGPTVLTRCHMPAHYTFSSVTPRDETLVMSNRASLAANLPVAAMTIAAEFEQGNMVELDWTMVGLQTLDAVSVRKADLQGDCEGATHYVAEVIVGAFEIRSRSSVAGGAGAGLVMLEGGQSVDLRRRDGNMTACEAARADLPTPPTECATMIQVELLPLALDPVEVRREERPSCPNGFIWGGSSCVQQSVSASNGGYECDPNNLAECQQQCQLGNERSCFLYGKAAVGNGESSGVDFLRQACQASPPVADACAMLGEVAAAQGDWPQAAQLRATSCAQGSGAACSAIAVQSLFGRGVPNKAAVDVARAPAKRGCALGDQLGCATLARLSVYTPAKASKELVAVLSATCKQGNRGACTDLITLREYGLKGFEKQAAEALKAHVAECRTYGTPLSCVRGGLLVERAAATYSARLVAMELYAAGCQSSADDWCVDDASLRAALPAGAATDAEISRVSCGAFSTSALACYNGAALLEAEPGTVDNAQAQQLLDAACSKGMSQACRPARLRATESL